ncbi:MAG: GNAT family N-acetyltransferase [Raineya sp.]|jgi:RimJ/RimL family protein N-acetyltransferase|nr:GNAT family N-acetyltransferase [Raineya sp.]
MILQLESERLLLLALQENQLMTLFQKGRNELEKELNLAISNFRIRADDSFLAEFQEVLGNYVIANVQKYPENYEWFTHWLIIEKKFRITVGGIGIGGMPDENHTTSIGYFIDEGFENQGIATEAVILLTRWMFLNKNLETIFADTLLEGLGSQKVLQKAGFTLLQEVEEGLRWQCKRSK